MLSLEDITMMLDFAKAEEENPSPRKKIDEFSTIYKSRPFRPPARGKSYGLPFLCDFGEARIGMTQETGPFIQPHIYRAPEVIFEMPWGSAIDIWNLAGLVSVTLSPQTLIPSANSQQTWDLFEGEHLFGDIFDEKGGHDPFKHLARMVALVGPPPREFIKRSKTTDQCFDPEGKRRR